MAECCEATVVILPAWLYPQSPGAATVLAVVASIYFCNMRNKEIPIKTGAGNVSINGQMWFVLDFLGYKILSQLVSSAFVAQIQGSNLSFKCMGWVPDKILYLQTLDLARNPSFASHCSKVKIEVIFRLEIVSSWDLKKRTRFLKEKYIFTWKHEQDCYQIVFVAWINHDWIPADFC